MRTAIICLTIIALSSLYIYERRHHVYSFVSELAYHADRFERIIGGR